MKDEQIHEIVNRLKELALKWELPVVTQITRQQRDPFRVLIATVLSLRTKDETTGAASKRLFALADNPVDMMLLSEEEIARAIYPVGFYKTKARNIREICCRLVEEYECLVPDDIEVLLSLPGVGRKTANLVVTLGYCKEGLCVDTHVHRISNRLGYVRTRTPEQTEFALRGKLPPEYWVLWNDLLVAFGQNLCKPVSPFCSRCPLLEFCDRVGVTHSR